ncbi:hypothetical protein KY329_01545 [Candidatus Woesearchaeota archaeon]|nr:hypothetical protein [Candidatus Woesearchaeota archaeon]
MKEDFVKSEQEIRALCEKIKNTRKGPLLTVNLQDVKDVLILIEKYKEDEEKASLAKEDIREHKWFWRYLNDWWSQYIRSRLYTIIVNLGLLAGTIKSDAVQEYINRRQKYKCSYIESPRTAIETIERIAKEIPTRITMLHQLADYALEGWKE